MQPLRLHRQAHDSSRGFTLLEMVVTLGISSACIAIGVPCVNTYLIASRETRAQAELRDICAAQLAAQAQEILNLDHQPPGEFLYLGELAALEPVRDNLDGRTDWGWRTLSSPLVSRGYTPMGDGVYEKNGYLFRVELEDPSGRALPELRDVRPSRFPDVDASETEFEVVAWPLRAGYTGRHVFRIDESGVIEVLSNEQDPDADSPEEGREPAAGSATSPGTSVLAVAQIAAWVLLVCFLEHAVGLVLFLCLHGREALRGVLMGKPPTLRPLKPCRPLLPAMAKVGLSILVVGIGSNYVPLASGWPNAFQRERFRERAACSGVERPPPLSGYR